MFRLQPVCRHKDLENLNRITVTVSLTDVSTADLDSRQTAQANLQRSIATHLFCCHSNEPRAISNTIKVWAPDDLQGLAAASPALLAEDITSAASQRWGVGGSHALLSSITTLHALA